MDTGIPEYKIPLNADRSEMPRYEHERQVYQQKVDAVRVVTVRHDMTQGFVLTQYFYEQLIQFEKDPPACATPSARWSTAWTWTAGSPRPADRVRQGIRRRRADAEQAAQAGRTGSGRGSAGGRRCGHGQLPGASGADRALRYPGRDRGRRPRQLYPGQGLDSYGHPEQAIDGFQKTLATSKDPVCWPGRISTWAACWTWTASAIRLWPSTRRR